MGLMVCNILQVLIFLGKNYNSLTKDAIKFYLFIPMKKANHAKAWDAKLKGLHCQPVTERK
jgi:hypothetical protein